MSSQVQSRGQVKSSQVSVLHSAESVSQLTFIIYFSEQCLEQYDKIVYFPEQYISQRSSYYIMLNLIFTKKNISHVCRNYLKNPIKSETRKICGNHPKIRTRWLYRRVMHPKDADGMSNSVDPDRTLAV